MKKCYYVSLRRFSSDESQPPEMKDFLGQKQVLSPREVGCFSSGLAGRWFGLSTPGSNRGEVARGAAGFGNPTH